MRRKTPECIFFPTNLTKVQTIRVDILKTSKFPLLDEFVQTRDGRMKLEKVADHEYPVLAFGQIGKNLGLLTAQRERLFDVYVLPCQQRTACEAVVCLSRRRNYQCLHAPVIQDDLE